MTRRACCRHSAPRRRLRIAVTVDMIATGTDVKPLECVFFMRDVRSGVLLRADEGPRRPHDQPTPTSRRSPRTRATKTRFVLVDAIGVTEHDYVDAAPLERVKDGFAEEAAGQGRCAHADRGRDRDPRRLGWPSSNWS
ncbi:MAG: hypothetical protein WKF47_13905 [Geodermatophilaceae bacterium]